MEVWWVTHFSSGFSSSLEVVYVNTSVQRQLSVWLTLFAAVALVALLVLQLLAPLFTPGLQLFQCFSDSTSAAAAAMCMSSSATASPHVITIPVLSPLPLFGISMILEHFRVKEPPGQEARGQGVILVWPQIRRSSRTVWIDFSTWQMRCHLFPSPLRESPWDSKEVMLCKDAEPWEVTWEVLMSWLRSSFVPERLGPVCVCVMCCVCVLCVCMCCVCPCVVCVCVVCCVYVLCVLCVYALCVWVVCVVCCVYGLCVCCVCMCCMCMCCVLCVYVSCVYVLCMYMYVVCVVCVVCVCVVCIYVVCVCVVCVLCVYVLCVCVVCVCVGCVYVCCVCVVCVLCVCVVCVYGVCVYVVCVCAFV